MADPTQPPSASLRQRALAEGLATGGLLIAIVGSGIMGERLANGNAVLALLANSLATGAALLALITTFGPISGAHMNPLVTLLASIRRRQPWRDVAPYVSAQLVGAFCGVAVAHWMFGHATFTLSSQARDGTGLLLGEVVATFGLITMLTLSGPRGVTASTVAAYILAAYWFTSSTSFANPAVTLARTLTDTFTGIDRADAPGFIAAQLIGAVAALLVSRALVPRIQQSRSPS